jgi:hypothetical protein
MARPWCGFFARVHEESAKRVKGVQALALAAILAVAVAPSYLRAEEEGAVLDNPVQNSAVLSLPAYDFETREQKKLVIGDLLRLTLKLPSEASAKAGLHFDEKDLPEDWQFEPESAPITAGEIRLSLHPLKAGELTLPSLAVKDADGNAVFRTNPLNVDVGSAIAKDDPKPKEPVDLRPPVELAFPTWVMVTACILAVLLLAASSYAIYRYVKKRKSRSEPVKPAGPPKPEDEVALAALHELQSLRLFEKGEFKKHYFKASEILKAYLGERFRFDALESTSTEIVDLLLLRKRVSESMAGQLDGLFKRMDQVKFSDRHPGDEASKLVSEIREVVLTTRKKQRVGTDAT